MSKRSTPSKRVSMADIAERAGVHKMTVSRALRGSPEISEAKRNEIIQLAKKMGYRKSALVSTVMGQMAQGRKVDHATPLMFLIDAPLKTTKWDPYLTRLIEGAKERANSLGFPLEVAYYDASGKYDKRLNTILETRNIQGLVINVAYREARKLNLNWDRLSAVTTGGRLLEPRDLPRVQSDVPAIIQLIIEQVTRRGYQRIGFHYSDTTQATLGNYISAFIAEYHSKLPKRRVIPALNAIPDDHPSRFIEWYQKYKPDVLVSSYENVLNWAAQGGLELKAPEDIGFACYGMNDPDSPLSGFYQDKAHLTERAIELVVSNIIHGRFGVSELSPTLLVPGRWNEGQTLQPIRT